MLPDLLNQIPPGEEIGRFTADGAYDTRRCHDAIAARNAHAVIPPHKNAKLWKPDTSGAMARNEAVRSAKYLGRALWRQLTGHHRQSHVEATSKPRRSHDALSETTWSTPLCARLQPAGCEDPNPCRNPKYLHRNWHTPNRARRLNPFGVSGSTTSS